MVSIKIGGKYFRSKNFIPIKPNTAYGLPNQILIDNTLYNGKYELNFYDDNKKYIGKVVDKNLHHTAKRKIYENLLFR